MSSRLSKALDNLAVSQYRRQSYAVKQAQFARETPINLIANKDGATRSSAAFVAVFCAAVLTARR